jgi:rhodanese-related sulfurtransferase
MTQSPAGVPTIDVNEAASRLEASSGSSAPMIVDVRELDEFRDVRIAGAALVPMSTFASRLAEIPKDRPLLVMCASGVRSVAATSFLLRNGWTDVVNVDGGIVAWQRAGLAVRRGQVEPGEGDL